MNLIKENPSIVSKGLKINGDLVSKGLLEIDGIINGDIEADVISIREAGKVYGNIKANILNVRGIFEGKVICEKINISDTAHLKGDIEYQLLSVDFGADINCQLKRVENLKNRDFLVQSEDNNGQPNSKQIKK